MIAKWEKMSSVISHMGVIQLTESELKTDYDYMDIRHRLFTTIQGKMSEDFIRVVSSLNMNMLLHI